MILCIFTNLKIISKYSSARFIHFYFIKRKFKSKHMLKHLKRFYPQQFNNHRNIFPAKKLNHHIHLLVNLIEECVDTFDIMINELNESLKFPLDLHIIESKCKNNKFIDVKKFIKYELA
ncbi:hypothetical protein EDEG_01473 [Edhazardia aedis USNM 41457]|uniref:Uncharacterized protein n=1 Tax=Edhazardia aedis (strain USNM 41457) TaxID=1003232 RepID=J9D9S5_EDHAE|nr:hypothetical protein EDEG_01473 [Edhazardia aedis USNM 41457]|eukprot:EJW04259.1 hypothetical protein EDEG_01473 [Edhazardia aedis USNM 41457]